MRVSLPSIGLTRTSHVLIVAGSLVALKLLLVGSNEIVAVGHDPWTYVRLAANARPLAELGPQPGYSMWLWLCRWIGIPQRIAIELCLAACAFLFAMFIGRRLGGTPGSAGVFALLLFSPATFHLFDTTLSDGFYACLTVAVSGTVGWLLLDDRRKDDVSPYIVLGLLLGVMAITRRETPITLALLLALLGALTVKSAAYERSSLIAGFKRAAPKIGLSCAIAVAIPLAVLSIHYARQRVWTLSAADLSSHLGLLDRLASIDTGEVPRRFIPISRQARERAYEASPTLARLKTFVEDPDSVFHRVSTASIGNAGELGAGWIWHIFGYATDRLGVYTPLQVDALYRQINGELDAAFASDRLKRRMVLHPLISPALSTWVPHLADSFVRVLRASVTPMHAQPDLGFDSGLYDAVALRRTNLTEARTGKVVGWAHVSPDRGETFGVTLVPSGPSVDSREPPTIVMRSGVSEEVRKTLGQNVQLATPFSIDVPLGDPSPPRIRVTLSDGRSAVSGPLTSGGLETMSIEPGDVRVALFIERMPASSAEVPQSRRARILSSGIAVYRSGPLWVVAVLVIVFAAGLHGYRVLRGERFALYIVLLVAVLCTWLFTRLGFYTVLDAAAWQTEPRYVLATGLTLSGLAGALLMSLFGKAGRSTHVTHDTESATVAATL